MVSPAWMALITTLTTPERSGAIIGAMGTAQGVGALIGPYFGGLLYRTVNHHAPFLASGVFLTIALVMALFVVHDPSPSTRRQ
jgi:MFS family permease